MADHMDSGVCAGSKRSVTETPSLEDEDLKESSSAVQEHPENMETLLGVLKKVKASCGEDYVEVSECFSVENYQLGSSESQEKLDSVSEKVGEENIVEVEVGLSGIQESNVEGDRKECMATEILLVSEKNRVLTQMSNLGAVFEGNKTLVDVDEITDGIKLIDGDVRHPMKIQVIDDTAVIESVQVPRMGNGCFRNKRLVDDTAKVIQMNQKKQLVDGKKARRLKNKAKYTNIVSGMSARVVQDKEVSGLNKGAQEKLLYSREEMQVLRLVNIVEQRKLWREIYTGLGDAVMKEYDNLASLKHQKQILKSFDPGMCFSSKSEAPMVLGKEDFENLKNETVFAEDSEAEKMNTIKSACSNSSKSKACKILEGEYSEDIDSDEDYSSIQRPAFFVEGEPNFESGSPEDGLEYLRRVRWEAARIPKVKVATCASEKVKKEQTVYMPQIPDIAPCPEHLLPLKEWEDIFLADFSKLRLVLSDLESSSTQPIGKVQPTFTVIKKSDSHQSLEDILIENFNNIRTNEMCSDQLLDGLRLNSSIEPPPASTTANDQSFTSQHNPKAYPEEDSEDYPSLSAILRMDSVARVSTLRKRIRSVETLSNLTKNDCLWLFALCAAVDTPLDADTSAALRSLLRKCACVRAGKSEHDDEVAMLNILATICGKYFGQSEG